MAETRHLPVDILCTQFNLKTLNLGVATLKQEWAKISRLNTELINAAFAFGRYHNKDNLGTPAKQAASRKRYIKAIDAMLEYLEGEKVIKMKTPPIVTTYTTGSKTVHLINKP